MQREYPEWWAWYVKQVTDRTKQFFQIIRDEYFVNKRNPLYIVRYEDLVLNQRETLMGLMGFVLGEKDLRGTNAERRID